MSDEEVLNALLKDKLENASISPKSDKVDEIICIIDKSGSMQRIKNDAQGGLNAFIDEQKKEGEANLTIVEFNTKVKTVVDRVNIKDAEEYTLRPMGGTALLDAIGDTVSNADRFKPKGGGKVIVVIVTDGEERNSTEWSKDGVFDLITERKEGDNSWEFLFLASGQDAIQIGSQYGFNKDETISFATGSRGIQEANNVAAVYTSSLRTMKKSAAMDMKTQYVSANADFLSDSGKVD